MHFLEKRKGNKETIILGFKKEFAFCFDASINYISTAFAPLSLTAALWLPCSPAGGRAPHALTPHGTPLITTRSSERCLPSSRTPMPSLCRFRIWDPRANLNKTRAYPPGCLGRTSRCSRATTRASYPLCYQTGPWPGCTTTTSCRRPRPRLHRCCRC